MIRVILSGIGGQMGRAVSTAIAANPDEYQIVAGIDAVASDPAAFGCTIYRDPADIPGHIADVIIDFSVPQVLPSLMKYAVHSETPVVIGTTGLGEREMRLLTSAAEHVAVFQSGNMSLGVNLQIALAKRATAALTGFDIEIIEKHHNRKVDAPSGTALMLADAIASQRTDAVEYQYGRHEKNQRRAPAELGIHSIRGGTIVGEHEVMFIGNDEVVEITHRAFSKQIFAMGALRAAKYLFGKPAGFYNMQNIMTEQDVASHLYALEEQAVVTISNLPVHTNVSAEIFDLIAAQGVFIDMISIALPGGMQTNVGFSLSQKQLSDAINALKPLQAKYPEADIHSNSNLTKLTVEGTGMALRHGIAAELMHVLSCANISMILVTTSETKIQFCVDENEVGNAIAEINQKFIQQ